MARLVYRGGGRHNSAAYYVVKCPGTFLVDQVPTKIGGSAVAGGQRCCWSDHMVPVMRIGSIVLRGAIRDRTGLMGRGELLHNTRVYLGRSTDWPARISSGTDEEFSC